MKIVTNEAFATKLRESQLNKTVPIMAAIIPAVDSFEIVNTAYHTWGQGIASFTFFVGQNMNLNDTVSGINIVKLPVSNLPKLYTVSYVHQVLKYLHKSQYDWFFISWSATYVNINAMYDLIKKLDPQKPSYLGHSSSQEGAELYCDKNSGILLSRGLLEALVPRLNDCDRQLNSYAWDLEIGECIQKVAGVTCSKNHSKVRYVKFLVTTVFVCAILL